MQISGGAVRTIPEGTTSTAVSGFTFFISNYSILTRSYTLLSIFVESPSKMKRSVRKETTLSIAASLTGLKTSFNIAYSSIILFWQPWAQIFRKASWIRQDQQQLSQQRSQVGFFENLFSFKRCKPSRIWLSKIFDNSYCSLFFGETSISLLVFPVLVEKLIINWDSQIALLPAQLAHELLLALVSLHSDASFFDFSFGINIILKASDHVFYGEMVL